MNDRKEISLIRKSLMPLIEVVVKSNAELHQALVEFSPVIKVEADVQATNQVDLSEITGELKKLQKSEPLQIPELSDLIAKIDKLTQPKQASLNDYRPHDQDDNNIHSEFFGFVHPSGAWYILNNQKGEQRYAAGSSDYPDNWDKRAKLKYDYLDKVL